RSFCDMNASDIPHPPKVHVNRARGTAMQLQGTFEPAPSHVIKVERAEVSRSHRHVANVTLDVSRSAELRSWRQLARRAGARRHGRWTPGSSGFPRRRGLR